MTYTKQLSQHLGPKHIRVNAVSPGPIKFPAVIGKRLKQLCQIFMTQPSGKWRLVASVAPKMLQKLSCFSPARPHPIQPEQILSWMAVTLKECNSKSVFRVAPLRRHRHRCRDHHKARIIAHQKGNDIGYILRLAESAEWRFFRPEGFIFRHIVKRRCGHRGFNRARLNTIYGNAIPPQFSCQRTA